MDRFLAVNVYDANDNAIAGASVLYGVKHKKRYKELGPLETQGIKDRPVSIQIPSELDDPVITVTASYKGHNKSVQVDTRQNTSTVIKLDDVVPVPEEIKEAPVHPNMWVNGSFVLAVFVVVVTGLLAVSTFVSWLAIPVVIIGAILVVTVIGVLTLKGNNQLRDESLVKLMEMTFQNLPLIKMLGRRPKQADEKRSPREKNS
jgi:hypothetical protein